MWGVRLKEKGSYSKFLLRGEGLIREGGLIERGLDKAFTVYVSIFVYFFRCYAALGDVSKARYLHQVNDFIDETTESTGIDASNHPTVRAKLAVLEKQYKQAEGIYLEQGMIDQAMEMYQELHKWDDSLEIAARKVSNI